MAALPALPVFDTEKYNQWLMRVAYVDGQMELAGGYEGRPHTFRIAWWSFDRGRAYLLGPVKP